jgi:hypothetical protein
MPPVGFEPTIPASARPQTYALDRAATGIGQLIYINEFPSFVFSDKNILFFSHPT